MSASIKSSDPDPIYILRSGVDSVTAVKFSYLYDEEVLISGNHNGLVQIWELTTKRVKLKFQASEGCGILQIDVLIVDEKKILISHDRKGFVKFWLIDGSCVSLVKTWSVHDIGFCPIHIHYHVSEHWIAYPSGADSQFAVSTISLTNNKTLHKMKTQKKLGMIMHVKLFTRDKILYALAGYEDGSVFIWNVYLCSVLHSKRIHQEPVMCLAVDELGEKFLSASADNIIHVHRINEEFAMEVHVTQSTKTSGFSACSVRQDRKIVICGGWDGKLRVYGWKKMKPLAILKYHEESLNAIAFSQQNLIAVACKDGKISLWNVYKDVM